MAMAKKVNRGALNSGEPLFAAEDAMYAPTHVPMAYNSHMCPRWPEVERRKPRLAITLRTWSMEKVLGGTSYGPSVTDHMITADATASPDAAPRTPRQGSPLPRIRCGSALPGESLIRPGRYRGAG